MIKNKKDTTKKLHFYVYRITNKLVNKIYIGCHQTDNLNDGYMGSGLYINRAYIKYGIENFYKEILNFYPDAASMFEAETRIVSREFIKEDSNYNLAEGGKGGFKGKACYASADRSAKISLASCNKVVCRNESGEVIKVDNNDPRLITKELVGVTKYKSVMKDVNGNILQVDIDDPRILTGELVGHTKGRAVMKDKNGNILQVLLDDPRILTGELVGHTKGSIQSSESNKKRSDALKGIPRIHTVASCVFCKKSTTLTNINRWHSNCC